MTNGSPVRDVVDERRVHAARPRARARRSATATPARSSAAKPRPSTIGFGSRIAATTRATPGLDDRLGARGRPAVVVARLERDVQRWRRGRARPPPRAPSPRRAGVPGPSCQPSPTTPAVAHDHGADHGVGRREARGPARARPRARRIVRLGAVHRRIRPVSEARRATTGEAARETHGRSRGPSSSPIPTVTVGPGIPPGPPPTGCRGVADCHRRWGLAPRPEDELPRRKYRRGGCGRDRRRRGRGTGVTASYMVRRSIAKDEPRLALRVLLHLGRDVDRLAVVGELPAGGRGHPDRDGEQGNRCRSPCRSSTSTAPALEVDPGRRSAGTSWSNRWQIAAAALLGDAPAARSTTKSSPPTWPTNGRPGRGRSTTSCEDPGGRHWMARSPRTNP